MTDPTQIDAMMVMLVGASVIAALLGKLLGDGLPALFLLGGGGATLIAASMIPRAEIAMVIMHKGQQLGPEVVPPEVYAGMVIVSAATCLLAPLLLYPLLRHGRRTKRKAS